MQTWLQSKNLREFIDDEASEDKVQTTLDGKSDEEKATYLRKRLKAYTAICMAMPESHIHLVQNTKEGDAYQAWANVKEEFQRNSAIGAMKLRMKLYTMKYGNYPTFSKFAEEIQTTCIRLKEMGDDVGEKEQVCLLMNGLLLESNKYKTTVTQILNTKDITFSNACSMARDDFAVFDGFDYPTNISTETLLEKPEKALSVQNESKWE